MAKLRVAYLVGRYPAVSHTFILREVQALRRLGVDVLPISVHRPKPEDLLSAEDRAEAARTYSLLPPRQTELIRAHLLALATRPRGYLAAVQLARRLARPGLRGALWSLFYLAEAGLLWNQLRRTRCQHVHVHHLNQAADAAMLALTIESDRGRRPAWTWSFTMHGPDEFFDVGLFRLREKALSAQAIACISDFARSQTMAFLPEAEWDKLIVVHCGLDVASFRRSTRTRVDPEGPLNLIYVGRMTPVKGQALLVEAVAQLRRDGLDVRATLVGEGPQRETLISRVTELGLGGVVTLPGAVGQDEIRALYEAADVFVLPSFAEGVPVVLMEAMALELPVVTTRVAGIPELVEHGVSGYVAPPGRVEPLVDALRELAGNPDLRRSMGEAGRQKVRAEFSIDDSGSALRDMFVRVIARGPIPDKL